MKHIIGHTGDEFYGSKDPTNRVKALKEDRVLSERTVKWTQCDKTQSSK